jgi:hypothetical protein
VSTTFPKQKIKVSKFLITLPRVTLFFAQKVLCQLHLKYRSFDFKMTISTVGNSDRHRQATKLFKEQQNWNGGIPLPATVMPIIISVMSCTRIARVPSSFFGGGAYARFFIKICLWEVGLLQQGGGVHAVDLSGLAVGDTTSSLQHHHRLLLMSAILLIAMLLSLDDDDHDDHDREQSNNTIAPTIARNRRSVAEIFHQLGPQQYTRRSYRMTAAAFYNLHRLLFPFLRYNITPPPSNESSKKHRNGARNVS